MTNKITIGLIDYVLDAVLQVVPSTDNALKQQGIPNAGARVTTFGYTTRKIQVSFRLKTDATNHASKKYFDLDSAISYGADAQLTLDFSDGTRTWHGKVSSLTCTFVAGNKEHVDGSLEFAVDDYTGG